MCGRTGRQAAASREGAQRRWGSPRTVQTLGSRSRQRQQLPHADGTVRLARCPAYSNTCYREDGSLLGGEGL